MTATADILLRLLRRSLWRGNTSADDTISSPVAPAAWRDIHDMARRQTVVGLAYSTLEQLPDHLLPPDDILMQWVADADAIEHANRRMNDALTALSQHIAAAGFRPILLKGQGVASLYPTPGLRQCGDIDLYTPSLTADPATLRQIAGADPTLMPDGAYSFVFHGINVELHPSMFDIANPLIRRRLHKIAAMHPSVMATVSGCGSTSILKPSPEADILLLATHILKHAIGRGIGLRQFCDMAMALQAYSYVTDPAEMRQLVSWCHLSRWMRHLCSLLVCHLGMPQHCLPYPMPISRSDADSLLRIVLRGGNFGRYDTAARPGKLHTAAAFVRRATWSMRIAPAETVCTVAALTLGQLKSRP